MRGQALGLRGWKLFSVLGFKLDLCSLFWSLFLSRRAVVFNTYHLCFRFYSEADEGPSLAGSCYFQPDRP